MASIINRIFRRKNKVPLACSEILLEDLDHVHTEACFIDVQPLIVAELFQSQGCPVCVKNVPYIHQAVQNNHNIAFLTFNVTYFDRPEWQDTFASKTWDARQRAYVTRWQRNSVFTPQVVFDGVVDGTGESANAFTALLDQTRELKTRKEFNMVLDTNDTELRIDTDRAESIPHDILLVYFDPKAQAVRIWKGANKWKKLNHLNVVNTVSKIGEWNGGNLQMLLPDLSEARSRGQSVLAIVQEPKGGPIVAAHIL
ncbi:thioredoxin-like protein [Aspergillus granulosus]|uniref:Thioredoxin-like protein n=1 Tax=Aspergillus granulosus TaxID=176169 RepID=A0ABR4HSZ4_9EURO